MKKRRKTNKQTNEQNEKQQQTLKRNRTSSLSAGLQRCKWITVA